MGRGARLGLILLFVAGGAGVDPQRDIALGSQVTVYPLARAWLQLGVSAGVRKVSKDATLNP